MPEIKRLKKITEQNLAEINALLKQLSPNFLPKGSQALKKALANGVVYIACDGKKIIGLASIFFRDTLMKKMGTIEDIIVDENHRGKGIGKKLMLALIKEAKKKKATCLDLTSRPERKTANLMYKALGFEKRKTNYYRLIF
jgi:ribosomal protein S18 acetylase RimI-like enzyme